MSLSQLFGDRLCVVNDDDQPVPVVSNVEDDETIDVIGIWKTTSNFGEILQSRGFYDFDPSG